MFWLSFALVSMPFYAASEKTKIHFSEKDIKIDTSTIVIHKLPVDFKKKYTDKEFVYEFKSAQKNAWDRFKEWLASVFNNIFNFTDSKVSIHFVEVMLKIIAFLIVIFVIYLITKSILNKEGQWIFGKNSDKKIIDYSDIEKNIHIVDFKKLVQTTIQNGENRLCIRYYYLWVLKSMATKNIIEWDIEKTNSDYLYEINNQELKNSFSYLSYLYNYIWYGEFDLDEATFEKAKFAFEKTLKHIGNE